MMSLEDKTKEIEKQHGAEVANLYVQINKLQKLRKGLDSHEQKGELDTSLIKLQGRYEKLTGVPYIR